MLLHLFLGFDPERERCFLSRRYQPQRESYIGLMSNACIADVCLRQLHRRCADVLLKRVFVTKT